MCDDDKFGSLEVHTLCDDDMLGSLQVHTLCDDDKFRSLGVYTLCLMMLSLEVYRFTCCVCR